MSSVQVEICIESVDDAVTAVEAGADRLEINAALQLGGVTPSLGMLIEIRRLIDPRVPVIAMVRPRAGDFCYSDREFEVMRRDADLFLKHGASGIAFGILTPDGCVDRDHCRQLIECARSCVGATEGAVFHRAFDFVRDPLASIEELANFGAARIMTSGQRATACEGAGEIARYIAHAAERVEILPAAGIRPENVEALVRATGCNQVHASLREPISTTKELKMASSTTARLVSDMAGRNMPRTATSGRLIKEMLKSLGK